MESAAVLRSFHCMTSPLKSMFEKPGAVFMNNAAFPIFGKYPVQGLAYSDKLIASPYKFGGGIVSCVKIAEAPMTSKPDDLGDSNRDAMSDSCQKGSGEKNSQRGITFPNGFKELIKEVCDNTDIAELKLKVGDFEMNLKRNIEPTIAPPPVVESPTIAPPIPTEPMNESATPAPPPSPPKPSAEKAFPFPNVAAKKSAKLAALEASGASGYVLVSSPTVGSFRTGRTLKGKKQPPIVKEGDVIKEGQTIGFLDQFGTELPVKSDVAGEVLKVLFQDGGAVGYGVPLVAVIPSFHDTK